MARTKKTAEVGHNGPTQEEQAEREALFLSHLDACRKADAALATAMEPVKVVRKQRNVVRNLASKEGFPLKIIDEIIEKEAFTQKDLEGEAELSRWMHQMAGLPTGGQAELFATTPAEIKDGLDWEADGYRAGMRGVEPKPPEGCPPRFHQEWMKGYHAGQERNAWALSEKGKIVDRRTDINTSQAVQLDPEPEDEFDADAEARKLKGAGFLDTTVDEQAEAA